MKKILSFAFAAMMLVSAFSFVSCKKQNEPTEPEMETPTVLTGTTWVSGDPASFQATLIFKTDSTGERKVINVIKGEVYNTESDITYTYKDGKGQYTDDIDHTYDFTVNGSKLVVKEIGYDEEYTYQK